MNKPANMLATMPVNKLIWKFAVPGIIAALINSVHNIVDQAFAGWGINDLAVGATNIVFPLAMLITALASLMGLGGAAVFSISMGKKDMESAGKYFGNAITMMVVIGVMAAAINTIFLESILKVFGATAAIMPYAKPYALIIGLGMPLGIFSTGMMHFIRSDGDPKFSSKIPIAGAVFNMVFDPIFLFGFHMGIKGIALATFLGQLLSTLMAVYYLVKKLQSIKPKKSDFVPEWDFVRRIAAVGIGPCFNHIIMTAAQVVLMNMLRVYGAQSVYGSDIAIAGAGAVGKVSIVLLSFVIGLALGTQPILGFNYGAKNYARVRETYLTSIKYGTIIATIAFLILQIFPKQLAGIFGSNDPLFYEFTTKYIRLYLFMTFVNALQPITSTFFTSIGKAMKGLWMSLIRQGLMLIPLLLLLPTVFGLNGVLVSGMIADGLAAVMVTIFAYVEMKNLKMLEASTHTIT